MTTNSKSLPRVIQLPLFDDEPVQVPLTQGYIALISKRDMDLAEVHWHLYLNIKRSSGPYARRNSKPIEGKRYEIRMHNVIMERILGRLLERGEQVDHINGNGLDNQRDNLRLVNNSLNQANSKLRSNNQSGYKGVGYFKKLDKWRARIRVNQQEILLGLFDTPEEAYEAYCQAAVKYFGEFARFE